MKDDGTGSPAVGQSARMLGVRPGKDIPVNDDDTVSPNTGGMSVAFDRPEHLPPHRRPSRFGGTGRDPVFAIEQEQVQALVVREKVTDRTRGLIEPPVRCLLIEFEKALADTREAWSLVA